MLTLSIMPLNLYGAYRHIQLNMKPCWSHLLCHFNSLETYHHGVATDQFYSHMTQYLSVISQSGLSFAISHIYTYASVPSRTSIFKLSILSILNKHILSYQHNFSTMTLHVKLSQGSDLSLQPNNKLVAAKKTSTTWAFQLEPTHCSENLTCCNEYSLSQPNSALIKNLTYYSQFEL